MMIDRKDKRFVSCPVCGRVLMKCQGTCNLEITCAKCNRDIVAIIDEDRVMVLENRRGSNRTGQVKVGVQKLRPISRCNQCNVRPTTKKYYNQIGMRNQQNRRIWHRTIRGGTDYQEFVKELDLA